MITPADNARRGKKLYSLFHFENLPFDFHLCYIANVNNGVKKPAAEAATPLLTDFALRAS